MQQHPRDLAGSWLEQAKREPGSTFFEPEARIALERAARALAFTEAILPPVKS